MGYRNSTYASGVTNTYWFEKNLQGDIIAIYDENAYKLVSYVYDAWGKVKTTYYNGGESTAAQYNPFRYRGYYYDSELGFYYLNSRYYDPETGRFISADGQMSGANGVLQGYNLFTYCFNNPVNMSDPTGMWPNWDTLVKGALLATIGALTVTAVVLTGGSCIPAVALAYSVVGTAGVTLTAMGASEVYESFTDNNPMREFMGDEMYDTLKYASVSVASMGQSIIAYGTSMSVCFVAGTLVEAEAGSVPIEQVAVGTKVYAHNPDTGETELKEVVNTFVRETNELLHIKVNGEHIITTPEHPFYVPTKGWTSAIQLRAGDRLQLLNGEYVLVEQVQHELLETPVTVYNFEVEDFHTYYVTDSAILVHNECGPNGTYEKAPYHNNGNPIKSAAPINGQTALNNSYSVGSNTTRRIGISDNQFVVFDETSPGIFHGHVRAWNELTQAMKNVLWDAGVVTKSGKIK